MVVSGELLALGLTVAVHIVGATALIVILLRNSGADWRKWWPDDDDGRGPKRPEPPDAPAPTGGGLPLPDASPSGVRLREPARLGDGYPRPARRPAHQPAPERRPEPEPAER